MITAVKVHGKVFLQYDEVFIVANLFDYLDRYTPGLGSCGITNSASDFIAAMNHVDMANGANPNNNPNCNRRVAIEGLYKKFL